jgi:endonuclease-3
VQRATFSETTVRISPQRRARVAAAFARLRQLHPDAHCELLHDGPFQLLVATVLSAQTTDKMVNQVTLIARIGFFRVKSRNIVALARQLVELHQGKVPNDFQALVALPGVGRKTANVVLGVCFGTPEGVVVDTHVQRLSQRLGWTRASSPEKIERELTALFPPQERDLVSHVLIFHGRRVCSALRPACDRCGASDLCPSAGHAEQVGRKK